MCVRLLPLALVLLAGCGPHHTGSGVTTTESRTLAACRGVRVGGQATVTVTRGDTPLLSVTWEDNLLELVSTEVRDGLLEVSVRGGSYSATTPLTVTVTLPELRSVRTEGQATVVADVGNVSDFTAIVSGQSRVTLRGSAERQDIDAGGQSHLDAGELTGRTATVVAAGQATVTTGVAERVQVIASGQSTVTHAAESQDVSTSGQATVRKR